MGTFAGYLALWTQRRPDVSPEAEVLRAAAADAALWPDAAAFATPHTESRPPLRVLLVAAHPDDESECAGFLYRITHEWNGIADQIVITNGEGGHRYSAPAAAYYRLPLNQESGREFLGRVRRKEQLRAARILGIRRTYFLDQKDTGATLDSADALGAWKIPYVRRKLLSILKGERYDLVLVLLPTVETHGHHKAVASLTLETIQELPAKQRPGILGVQTASHEATDSGHFPQLHFEGLQEYPLTRTSSPDPLWSFDRRKGLSCDQSLDHTIVVGWAASEHKSQGFFQMESGRKRYEHYWLFDAGGTAGLARWSEFLKRIEP